MLRDFNNFERSILSELCNYDKTGRCLSPNCKPLEEIMKRYSEVLHFKKNQPNIQLEFYINASTDDMICRRKVLDIIVLIHWLEENGYIYLFPYKHESDDTENTEVKEENSDSYVSNNVPPKLLNNEIKSYVFFIYHTQQKETCQTTKKMGTVANIRGLFL